MKKLIIAIVFIMQAAVSYSQNNSENEKEALANSIAKESMYYGLIIGVSEYDDENLSDLEYPVLDAERIYNVLIDSYSFKRENTILLQNPSRVDIVENLDALVNLVGPNDNLLIFYAGHGQWDQNTNIGYWLPSDAKKATMLDWFPDSLLIDYFKKINSKHTLLITDASFSGSIFKSRAAPQNREVQIQTLYDLPGRKAITSCTLSEVEDNGTFARIMIQSLKDNNEILISSEELFRSFRMAVMSASNSIPQFGTIEKIGDQGGDFIFLKSK